VARDFHLVMSLLGMSLGGMFCLSRQGGTREGGWVQPKNEKAWKCPGLDVEALVGTGRAISLLLRTNGLRMQSSHPVGSPFLPVKLFSVCTGSLG